MLSKRGTSAAVFAACVGVAVCGRDDRVPAPGTRDTAAGVVDSAPASVATGVAAILTDENVFALLDTTYAAMLEADQLAQEKATNPQLKAFANRAVTEHALARRQIAALTDRLNVAPVLPDREVLAEHRESMQALRARTGRDFDRAFLEHAAEARQALISEVDDALGGARQESLEKFLRQLRSTLEAELKTVQGLAQKIG